MAIVAYQTPLFKFLGHSSGAGLSDASEPNAGGGASAHGWEQDSHILHFEQLLHQLLGGQFSQVSPSPSPGQGDVNE